MALSKDPAARARQLANLKAFEKGHAPLPGVGRPKKVTDKLDVLFEQRCTNQRILDQLFPNDTPKQRGKRTNGDVLVAAAMQRATVKSDLLTREIFDRIEGKVPDEAEISVAGLDTLAERIAEGRKKLAESRKPLKQ